MKEEATVSLAAADNTDDEVSVDAAAFYFFLIRSGHHFLDKRRRKIRRRLRVGLCIKAAEEHLGPLSNHSLCALLHTKQKDIRIIYPFP